MRDTCAPVKADFEILASAEEPVDGVFFGGRSGFRKRWNLAAPRVEIEEALDPLHSDVALFWLTRILSEVCAF